MTSPIWDDHSLFGYGVPVYRDLDCTWMDLDIRYSPSTLGFKQKKNEVISLFKKNCEPNGVPLNAYAWT